MDLLWLNDNEAMFEIRIDSPVWESSSADSDPFQDTITGQLMHYQGRIKKTRCFVIVWDNATDEVRISGIQCCKQSIKLGPEG